MAWGDRKVSRWGWKWVMATDRLPNHRYSLIFFVCLSYRHPFSIHPPHMSLSRQPLHTATFELFLSNFNCLFESLCVCAVLARPLLLCCKLLFFTLFHVPFSEHVFGCLTLIYILPVCCLSSESLDWRVETAKWEAHTRCCWQIRKSWGRKWMVLP